MNLGHAAVGDHLGDHLQRARSSRCSCRSRCAACSYRPVGATALLRRNLLIYGARRPDRPVHRHQAHRPRRPQPAGGVTMAARDGRVTARRASRGSGSASRCARRRRAAGVRALAPAPGRAARARQSLAPHAALRAVQRRASPTCAGRAAIARSGLLERSPRACARRGPVEPRERRSSARRAMLLVDGLRGPLSDAPARIAGDCSRRQRPCDAAGRWTPWCRPLQERCERPTVTPASEGAATTRSSSGMAAGRRQDLPDALGGPRRAGGRARRRHRAARDPRARGDRGARRGPGGPAAAARRPTAGTDLEEMDLPGDPARARPSCA